MDSSPRVLFINHSIRDGGPGKSLYYILKFLGREKLTPCVLIPKDDVFSERLRATGLYENIIIDGRFPENLKRPWFSGGGAPARIASLVLNILDLASLVITSPVWLRRQSIDVIYCNGTQAKVVGAIMGLINGTPVVWHVRNIQQTRLLGTIINSLAALPSVKRIICVSGAAAAQFPYGREKITVVYNGTDVADYDPAKTVGELRDAYDIPAGTVVVGSTGRIVPRKGYDLFIEAAAVAIREYGEREGGLKFVIVGDTPYFFEGDHLAYLKKLVAEKGLEDNFIFTGYRDDVRPCLKDFDVFVIPSNYPDPFPRSVIEGMSFALPVVAFKAAGGIVEAVDDGVTGILCAPGDTEEMGNAIARLALDTGLGKKMGEAGRGRVIAKFSAEAVAREVEKNIFLALGRPPEK
ncbi:MAG: glycosyltransferase family 4 protein [Candidatus Dadabacteria bacterium]|nr:glycosyltransferase family 4 protein [Candidatus Dadabacteria bacterium]